MNTMKTDGYWLAACFAATIDLIDDELIEKSIGTHHIVQRIEYLFDIIVSAELSLVERFFEEVNFDTIKDPYAGTFAKLPDRETVVKSLHQLEKTYPECRNYRELGNEWLSEALSSILRDELETQNDESDRARLEKEDFWEPIEVELSNEVQDALSKTERALEAIRNDNGYASEHQAERNEVITAIEIGLKQIRTQGAISISYFKAFIWEPLERAGKRFGKSVVGIAITAAKESLKEAFRRFFDSILNP